MKSYPELYSEAGEAVSRQMKEGAIPHAAYPRPMLVRDSYLCLNGVWDFCVTSEKEAPSFDRKINIPFVPESLLSGINERFNEESTLWYRREFCLPEGFMRSRLILHVGACDSEVELLVNGVSVGRHVGGYEAFSFDITDALTEKNIIVFRVTDRLSRGVLPYGKQRHKRGGMWYTPISGIWQTVWLESLPERAVESLSVKTLGGEVTVSVEGVDSGEIRARTPSGDLTAPIDGGKAIINIENPRLWSPDDPYLYHYEVTAGEDRVRSYFAFRSISIEERSDGVRRLYLNGKPIFLNGVLDQGYFSDGIFTPAAPECYTEDILAMKRLGLNTLRKHIKVEPQIFYSECDRLGMIVIQDMVQNGRYSFLRDTALPTVGLIRRSDVRLHRDPETRAAFVRGMEQTVRALEGHPSVCVWTIFNEGWGQFCADEMYAKLKELDPTRPIDSTSGWFGRNLSDFESRHIYFKPIRLKQSTRPILLSEFGGYCLRVDGHLFGDGNYGYRRMRDGEEFCREMTRLYNEEVLPAVSLGLCGAICTQLSDVEDETNGFLTYDRRVAKLPDGFFEDFNKRISEILEK